MAEVSTQKDILEISPYIDPQHLEHRPNKKSDVYSVGVLLWEISSGQKPFKFYDKFHQKPKLILEILNGKRETLIPDTPIDYINIYTSIILYYIL